MISLNPREVIGKGTNRLCYINPDNEKQCIKVTHSSDDKETINEVNYYKFLQDKDISWNNLAQYYGQTETNMGKGYIFELIRDYDNNISRTLTHYIKKERDFIITKIKPLLSELELYCLKNGIIVKDLNTKNILLNKIDKNSYNLVIIDGLSNNKRISYLSLNKVIFKYIHNRSWTIFKDKIKNNFQIYI